MKQNQLLLAFILLIALATAQAPQPPSYANSCTFSIIGSAAQSVLPLVFMLVIVMISIAYLFGHGLHQPRFEVWAKDEFANLLISAVFIIGIFSFFSLGCLITDEIDKGQSGSLTSSSTIGGTNQVSPFTIVYTYLDEIGLNYGMRTVEYLTKNSLEQQFRATSYLYVGMPIFGGWGVAYKANYKAFSQQSELLIDLAMPAITSIRIQRSIFVFIEQMAFSVMFPLALILRAFPFTRDYGNYLLAVTFGLYVVLPLTYVLFANVHYNVINSNPELFIGDRGNSNLYANSAGIDTAYWYKLGILFPQAILFPNIAIIIVTTAIMALSRAFKSIAA